MPLRENNERELTPRTHEVTVLEGGKERYFLESPGRKSKKKELHLSPDLNPLRGENPRF